MRKLPPQPEKPKRPIGRPSQFDNLHLRHSDGSINWGGLAADLAIYLAAGKGPSEIHRLTGVSRDAIWKLRQIPEFAEEVDNLTMMTGLAQKAERVRMVKRVIAQMVDEESGHVKTKADALDWMKYLQGETENVKLDLTALIAAISPDGGPVARIEPTRLSALSATDDDEDEWTDGSDDPIS